MAQTIVIQDAPMTELKSKLLDTDILEHHGILGMKWGVRRFQKYPKGYSGDGKYVGPDGQPRQPTKKEAKSDRKYNELKTKIDKWLVDAVETGDKKALKVLKKTMTPQEYQSAYDTLVKTGVQRAIKEGNKDDLKKYKNDISKRDYKDAKVMADFNDAVNKMDTKRMNTLVSKIKNEDVKAAAARIATTTEFNKKKIEALKVESEASAKLAKAATTISNVATIATKTKAVYDAVSGIKKSVEDRSYELQKRAEEINKANEKSEIDKIIRSGNIEAFEKNKSKFSNEQIEEFKKRVYLNNEKEINKAILTGDAKGKEKWAEYLSRANVETLNKATTKNEQGNKGNTNNTNNNNKTDNTQTSKKNQNGLTKEDLLSENDSKETARAKEKYVELAKEIKKANSGNSMASDAAMDAMEAYTTLSFPNLHSESEVNKARQIVKDWESGNKNVAESFKTSNVTTMADAIKSGTTANIKDKLDSAFSANDKPNIYFNGVRYTTVDEDNPNYYINGKKVNPKLKHSALEDFENFLEHHGINGMHWGVRNGPPYPLDK